MMLQSLLGAVAVVVRQLHAFREIIFRYQHEVWTTAEHHRLRHQVAVARVVHEPTQLARFRGGVDATGRIKVRSDSKEF